MLRVLALAAAAFVANAFNGVKPSVQPAALAPLRKAAGAAALAVGGLALPLQPAVAGVCSYAPNSDLCVAEKAKEAKLAKDKPKAAAGGKASFAAPAAPKPKPPPPVPLTKEAQALKDAKDKMAKLSSEKAEASKAVADAKAALAKLPEQKVLAAAEAKLASKQDAFDADYAKLQKQLPGLKETADKKARKDAFVAKNKKARLAKEAKAKADEKAAKARAKAAEQAKKNKK